MFSKAFALVLVLATSATAQTTPVSEVLSAALVAPFDQRDGHKTYLTAHGGGAFSPLTGTPAVITHWTFWSEDCQHLANFNVCLTQDDSVVIDVSDMGAIGPDNSRLDSRFDLTGFRGLVTVHAYQTDARCRHPGDLGFQLLDHAIWGTWSIANTLTNAAAGDRMQSLNLGDDGSVAVPDERFRAIDLAFFNPESLTSSEAIFLVVVERFGDYVGEIGPPQGRVIVGTQVQACDVQEQCLSLPDLQISCALFSSLIPSPGSLIPPTLMPGSSGFLRLSSPRFVVEDPAITGGDLWIFAWHLQQLGAFGTGARGTYLDPVEFATPTPTPSATPTPSLTPGATPTLPVATATPSPAASATPGVSPTPTNLPSETPLTPTPSPGGSPTPIASPTGTEAPSPTPLASPSATPAVSPTPTATPTPSSTPSPALPTPTIFGP